MNLLLDRAISQVYRPLNLDLHNLQFETESQEYGACRFELNGKKFICRNAKQTPKKIGQFVTFWKRDNNGPIAPFGHDDPFDYFIVNTGNGERFGLFIIPKSEAVKRGLVSTTTKEGKRAFRVYPPWDNPTSTQAIRSKKWQLAFFHEVGKGELERISDLLV